MKKKCQVIVDEKKCIGCGKCVKDCVGQCLTIQDGKAVIKSGFCIECGHCFAACPVNAVDMLGYDTEDCHRLGKMNNLDSDELLLAMKSRRSIRQFKKKIVSDECINKILEAGRYCPTARNSQDVSYIVLNNNMAAAEKEAVYFFRKIQKVGSLFYKPIKNMTVDKHFFFKEAPLVIIVSQKGKSSVNGALASSYMELMAESMGLGVLYSGFLIIALKYNRKLRKIVGLSKGEKPVTCLVIGYPNVSYNRIVPRKPLKLRKKSHIASQIV